MPPISDNYGSVFYNINNCKSFNQSLSTILTPLSANACSEVIIWNQSNAPILIFDNNNFDSSNSFLLSATQTFKFMGITNSNSISAKTVAGEGTLYFRTQTYSCVPAR